MKKIILLLAFILALNCSSTKTSIQLANPTDYANTITSEELKEMLYTFASDDFQGRETGEAGQKKAVEYLKKHYQQLDIKSPLGKNNYFQKVDLIKSYSPKITMVVNGRTLAQYTDFIPLGSASSQTINTQDIVFAGYGIDSKKYSDYKNIDVNGKVVLVKQGEPKNSDGTYITTGTKENTKWSSGRSAISAKRMAAKEHGAKAIIFINDNDFSRVANFYKRRASKGGMTRFALNNNEDEIIQLMVGNKTAKLLFDAIETSSTPTIVNTQLSLTVKSNTEAVDSENVIAYIEGSEFPDEVIIISAHLDHEGVKDGKIYNGADDDGSGSMAILEIAEAFQTAVNDGYTPKRSIAFLHVTAEEKGLLGSKYYTDYAPIFPLENTVANLNIDMIGRVDDKHLNDRNYLYLIGSDKLSTELHELSEAVNEKYTKINLDYTYNDDNDPNRFYYRSDHYNFAKHNIPVIFYFNGTHDDYHKPSDTPDKIEYDLLAKRAQLVFYTAWEIANRDKRIALTNQNDISKP